MCIVIVTPKYRGSIHLSANIDLLFMFRSMGNLSNSSSDQSGHRTQGAGDLGGGQYSPIHRELGAILKAETDIPYHWPPIIRPITPTSSKSPLI